MDWIEDSLERESLNALLPDPPVGEIRKCLRGRKVCTFKVHRIRNGGIIECLGIRPDGSWSQPFPKGGWILISRLSWYQGHKVRDEGLPGENVREDTGDLSLPWES